MTSTPSNPFRPRDVPATATSDLAARGPWQPCRTEAVVYPLNRWTERSDVIAAQVFTNQNAETIYVLHAMDRTEASTELYNAGSAGDTWMNSSEALMTHLHRLDSHAIAVFASFASPRSSVYRIFMSGTDTKGRFTDPDWRTIRPSEMAELFGQMPWILDPSTTFADACARIPELSQAAHDHCDYPTPAAKRVYLTGPPRNPDEGQADRRRHRETVIRECGREGAREDTPALRAEYTARLNDALAFALPESPLHPVHLPPRLDDELIEDTAFDWIPTNRVLVDSAQDLPYHYTVEALHDYAVTHRGDYEEHLSAMGGLYVSEYPTPRGIDPVYQVTTNGNHRRLVFATIGLTSTRALVTRCAPGFWTGGHGVAVGALDLMQNLKLLTPAGPENPRTGQVWYDPTGCAGWVIPATSYDGKPVDIPETIVANMARFEALMGTVTDNRVAVLRDLDALRTSLYALYEVRDRDTRHRVASPRRRWWQWW